MKKVEHSRAGIKLQSLRSQGQCIYHHAALPYIYISRLTIVSREAKKKQAVRYELMSVLFTGSTDVKFVNTLNKPPLKLSLSYQGLSTF